MGGAIAPLEYALATTSPNGSSTKPVDSRLPLVGLTNAPVAADIASASALCPRGEGILSLSASSTAAVSSSVDEAATLIPASSSRSLARWNARSCALQYGHHDPR